MQVYVETNYILELALEQEQISSCSSILSLAETNAIQLLLPAFSIAESYETFIRRAKNRETLAATLDQEMRQLSRSRPYTERIEALQHVASLLIQSIKTEQGQLNSTLETLLQVTETIPLGHTILRAATTFQQNLGLSPQNALIYASVLEHLQQSDACQKCFLNRNSRDFDDPYIVDTLAAYNCKMIFRFDHGYGYIKETLSIP